jgi:hypothetical protein
MLSVALFIDMLSVVMLSDFMARKSFIRLAKRLRIKKQRNAGLKAAAPFIENLFVHCFSLTVSLDTFFKGCRCLLLICLVPIQVRTFIFVIDAVQMEQHPFKNVNNCLNSNIYSYLETSGGLSSNP